MEQRKEMRAVYAETLAALADEGKDIVVVEADLMRATGTGAFAKRHPGRVVNVGVAEANLVGVAAGLSAVGRIPFAATFGCFASRRAYDQFFLAANYAHLNVKLVGTDPGVTAAFNGGTHMPLEDLALMRAVPGLTILEPSDAVSLEAFVRIAAERHGCFYLRLQRKAAPPIYPEGERFELGKAKVLRSGGDVTIVALGALMVGEALRAADLLAADGVEADVVDALSVAPLDTDTIMGLTARSRAVVSCENHRVTGGLGSAIAELIAEGDCAEGNDVPNDARAGGEPLGRPIRLARIGAGAQDFGEVGTQDWLAERFKLTAPYIVAAAKRLHNRR